MGNGGAEWARLCLLDINVDPLVIASGLGEGVHLLLSDRGPVADSDLLTGSRLERLEGGELTHVLT